MSKLLLINLFIVNPITSSLFGGGREKLFFGGARLC